MCIRDRYDDSNFHDIPRRDSQQVGRLEVICGSMFSGKTEELLRRLRRAKFAKQQVEIFKPAMDTRYSAAEVVSHDRNTILSTPVEHSSNILLLSSEAEVVGIDEAQFFDQGLVEVCLQLADQGARVIVAGLDMDFKRNPFGPIPVSYTHLPLALLEVVVPRM